MKRNRLVHGAAVVAPDESFIDGESPVPSLVAESSRVQARPRAPRGRLFTAIRFLAGLAIVLGVAAAVAMSAHRYAVTSSRFALEKIDVRGGKRIGPEQAQRLGGVTPGTNLFGLDTQLVEQRLLQDPWVKSARVVRELPSTLKIELGEREAVALAQIQDTLYVVSSDGEPFKPLSAEDPVDLPVVTGISPTGLARDRGRELERLTRALEVLRQYRRLKLERTYPAQEVHLDPGGSVRLVIGSEGISLSLGSDSLRQRLLMAERVVTESRAAGRLPGIVFADNTAHPERVVVRMR